MHPASMLLKLLVSLICITLTYALPDTNVDDVNSVVLVQIIFRHGDRNPIEPNPNDEYKSLKYWPEGFGELTKVGMKQHYEFGQYVRNRYKNFLSEEFLTSEAHFHSTAFERTIMSALAFSAGLYPPTKIIERGLKWQPISIHNTPIKQDKLLYMGYRCEAYDTEFKTFLASDKMKKYNAKHKPLYDYVTKHSGRHITDPRKAQWVYDTLWIQQKRGYKLPHWVNTATTNELEAIAAFKFTLEAHTDKLKRLISGPILNKILHNMMDKISKELTPDRKLFVYSAHDNTVANILMALDAFYPHTPPYTAAVFFELHQINSEYFVSVIYRNVTSKPPFIVSPSLFKCTFSAFKDRLKKVIPANWDEECKKK